MVTFGFSVHTNPTVCAINIMLDSSEQPQHAHLATQKPHKHSEGPSLA